MVKNEWLQKCINRYLEKLSEGPDAWDALADKAELEYLAEACWDEALLWTGSEELALKENPAEYVDGDLSYWAADIG